MKSMLLFLLLPMIAFALPEEKPPMDPPRMRGRNSSKALAGLSEAERKELLDLRKNNPEEFRNRMRKLMPKPAEHPDIAKLLERYRAAKNDAEREKIKGELHVLLTTHFKQRLTENRKQIEFMQKRIDRMRADCDRREKDTEKIVSGRMAHLLNPSPETEAKMRKQMHFDCPPPPTEKNK